MLKFRVKMRSAPGMWERYDGHVDVTAEDAAEAIERARDQLKRTSFPDRSRGDWIVEGVEIIGEVRS